MVFTGLLLAAPGWAQTGTAEQELLNLERQWKEAVVARDVAALQRLYADDYISVDSEGPRADATVVRGAFSTRANDRRVFDTRRRNG
jgi:ketosteroid isomerase-like protein